MNIVRRKWEKKLAVRKLRHQNNENPGASKDQVQKEIPENYWLSLATEGTEDIRKTS